MTTHPIFGFMLLAGLLTSAPAGALETDQFYAWGKPINDSGRYLNAWVILQVQSALDTRPTSVNQDCEAAVHQVQKNLQHSIYQPVELWILSSDLVDRIPIGEEANRDYRSRYLLSKTFAFDYARMLQPSPTLQVNGLRFGSDKLAHFFSEGWWYYKYWRKHRDDMTAEQLQRGLFEFGVKLENSIQGMKMTGVFSPADLEANYQGFRFYQNLCRGDKPLLSNKEGRWQFSDSFDIGNYISPAWDESWNPNVYSPKRWEGIRSTMATYCPALTSEWVKRQRSFYAAQDQSTPTGKLIQELVSAGELPDPITYDITVVCRYEK